MIKTMWYPHHYSPLAQGVQSGHIEIGIIGAEHLAQEFAPELKRFFHLRFGQAAATP
jgi:ATP phosphoribosyltransferase